MASYRSRLRSSAAILLLAAFAGHNNLAWAQLSAPPTAQPAAPQPGEVPLSAPRTPVFPQPLGQPGQFVQSDRVAQILIEGNERIEASTVLSYMALTPGDTYNAERVDQSLKALFATGLFADVSIRREGAALIVRIVENPVVNRIAFEGNRRIDDETLQKEVQLKVRQVFTRAKVQADLQRILQIYRRSGRFAANIEPKIITLPQNRVDVVFEIDEGSQTQIASIRFIGNEAFSDSRLREEVSTKETAWYRLFGSGDTYDPDRLNFDRELLRRFYLSRGYADFRILSAAAELAPSRDEFFITFAVEEGQSYDFGAIDVKSELKGIDVDRLRTLVQGVTAPGDTYNATLVDRAVQRITNELGALGYAFVEVRPEVNKDRDGRTMGITYTIGEGARVYVERINISGNIRTLDRVIRREFAFAEGDAFNTSKLQNTRSRLRGLNFFEKVDITDERGSAPDKIVVNVNVEEKSTGELNFGAGYSTVDSVVGDISVRERNFLGRGQDVRVGLTVSPRRQQFDLGFTEPYFLDRDLSAGFDLFRRRLDLQDRSNYDLLSDGVTLRFGFPWTDYLTQNLYYRLRRDTVENVGRNATRFVRSQEGTSVTSSVGYGLTYDRRNDRLEPTEGYILRFNQEFGGIGGTERFIKTTGNASLYYSPLEDVVLITALDAGYVTGIDDNINVTNRFYLGGESFRGFSPRGIGARDRQDGSSLGGNIYYTGTAELEFPVGLPDEYGVKGRIFSVAGSLYDVDDSGPTLQDSSSLRATVGAGVSWKSPFGPIRLDLGFPILKEDYDRRQVFFFSYGTRF